MCLWLSFFFFYYSTFGGRFQDQNICFHKRLLQATQKPPTLALAAAAGRIRDGPATAAGKDFRIQSTNGMPGPRIRYNFSLNETKKAAIIGFNRKSEKHPVFMEEKDGRFAMDDERGEGKAVSGTG